MLEWKTSHRVGNGGATLALALSRRRQCLETAPWVRSRVSGRALCREGRGVLLRAACRAVPGGLLELLGNTTLYQRPGRKTNGCAGGGLRVCGYKKAGCNLIVENPRRGILAKHAALQPSSWDRCEASVIGVEQGSLLVPARLCVILAACCPCSSASPSAKKKNKTSLSLVPAPAPCSEAGADFCRLSSENSPSPTQQPQLVLLGALLFCSESRSCSSSELRD